MEEHRCRYCRKLFFKGYLQSGLIEIKCRYCKNINIINGKGDILSCVNQDSLCKK